MLPCLSFSRLVVFRDQARRQERTAQRKLRRADHRHPALAVLHRAGSRKEPRPFW
jgi:hypothetical protein